MCSKQKLSQHVLHYHQNREACIDTSHIESNSVDTSDNSTDNKYDIKFLQEVFDDNFFGPDFF